MKDIDGNSVAVVVLDTNILLQDPLLERAHLDKVFLTCRKYGIAVIVPEVVLDELLWEPQIQDHAVMAETQKGIKKAS